MDLTRRVGTKTKTDAVLTFGQCLFFGAAKGLLGRKSNEDPLLLRRPREFVQAKLARPGRLPSIPRIISVIIFASCIAWLQLLQNCL